MHNRHSQGVSWRKQLQKLSSPKQFKKLIYLKAPIFLSTTPRTRTRLKCISRSRLCSSPVAAWTSTSADNSTGLAQKLQFTKEVNTAQLSCLGWINQFHKGSGIGYASADQSLGAFGPPGKQRLLSDHSLLKGFAPPALAGS